VKDIPCDIIRDTLVGMRTAKAKNITGKPALRVLVQFPAPLLSRADSAAASLKKSRNEFVRTSVEHMLQAMERRKLNGELQAAYLANARRNLDLLDEFAEVDFGSTGAGKL
jgi:metal-responsive CopG/Arc/MetJ family transcriptional regulator